MKKYILVLETFCLLAGFALRAQTLMVDTFYYTGATQTFVIPQCASNLTIMLHGAQGGRDTLNGGYSGGFGGRIYVVMTATPGTLLYVNVGGPGHLPYGGWNGGGNGGWGVWSPAGGGGGASDIRVGGNALSDRIFVAGGGGGAGGFRPIGYCIPTNPTIGGGGGGMACTTSFNTSFPACPPTYGCGGEDGNHPAATAGCNGGTVSGDGAGGGGGGMTSGGGVTTSTNGCTGTAGALFQGGAGGDSLCTNTYALRGFYGGGGGGGGYYGGGGGHSSGFGNNLACPVNGAGGGGSTYLNNSFVLTYSLWGGNVGTAGIYNPVTNVNSGAVTFSYIVNGPVVSAAASQDPVCPGAPVVLTAGGANSFTWLPAGNFGGATSASVNVNPTGTTQYSVQGLGASGCVSQAVITIHVSGPTLSVTASPAFSVCSGEPVSLSAAGASIVSWSGGIQNNVPFTPSVSGVYTVSATDSSGCSTSTSVAVFVTQPSTVSIAPLFPAVCPGGSVGLSVSGAASYSWSTGQTGPAITVSPPVSTVYSFTGSASTTNVACPSSGSVQVLVYPVPVLTVSATQTLMCLSEQVTVSAGGAITYTWLSAGGTPTVNPGWMIVSPANSITYSVTGTAGNTCKTEGSVSIQVNACTGIADLSVAPASVFPNPTHGTFYVQPAADAQLTIYSSIGKLTGSAHLLAGEKKEFHISSPGVYFIHYQSVYGRGSFKLLVLD